MSLDELLARADFITLHTPLTDATRNIIDAAAIAKMKRGVRIINCARGGLVVEEDLAAALDSGQVAGAAIDVFVEEPARQNPLFGRDNLVATPHLGAATTEAQENVALQIAEQMADFLLTGAVSNAVNMPSLTAEEAARLRPYMMLAEQLGSFAGQLTETGIRAVEIEYEGAVADLNVKPLTATALTGLLAPQLATRQHGQRAGDLPPARHPGQRDPPCRCRRLSEPDPGHGHDRAAAARQSPAPSSPATSRASSISRASRSKPNSAGTCCSCAITTSPGFIGALGQALGESRGQYRDISPRPHRAGPGCDRADRGRPAADPDSDRHRAPPAECDPGQGDALLRLSAKRREMRNPGHGGRPGFRARRPRGTVQPCTVIGGSDGSAAYWHSLA